MGNIRHTVDMFNLATSIARVVDLMSPALGDHHMRVAYLAYRLGEEIGIPVDERYELATAGALHDIGAFSLQERLDLLDFEDAKPGEHALAGCLLLKDFKPFSSIAKMIRFHHIPWRYGKGMVEDGKAVPPGSHIIHLADRVAVKISKEKGVLGQVPAICEAIMKSKNEVFVPEHVDAMLSLAKRDHVWLEVTSNAIESILQRRVVSQTKEFDIDEFLDLSQLICRLIDFKSEFTATHSTGVAATAVAIAKQVGFSKKEQKLMEIAGNLHDLGKIAIPSEILEKPGRLSDKESFVMRAHVYYTYEILEPIDIMGVTSAWGALHQERLDGSGYPFGYTAEEIPLGSKIMGVADVFTALTEGRPYRGGMNKTKTVSVLQAMSDKGKLDANLIRIVTENFDEMNRVRELAQDRVSKKYRAFRTEMSKQSV